MSFACEVIGEMVMFSRDEQAPSVCLQSITENDVSMQIST